MPRILPEVVVCARRIRPRAWRGAATPWRRPLEVHDRDARVRGVDAKRSNRWQLAQVRVDRGPDPSAAASMDDSHLGVAVEDGVAQKRVEEVNALEHRLAVEIQRGRRAFPSRGVPFPWRL